MNIAHLKFVVETSNTHSFSQAAEKCHVTQSTLSHGVAEVEKELGAKLFERTTRSVTLSPFGESMIPLITTILNAESNLILQAKNYLHPEKALIKIGTSPLLNPAFTSMLTQSFKEKNPNYEIVLYEENLTQLQKMLLANSLDFIFVPLIADFTAEFGKMRSLFLYDEPLVLITQDPTLLLAGSVSAKTLKDQKLVMVPDACGLARVTREIFRKAKVPLNEYEGKAFSYSALTDWAQNGIGSAVLPKSKVSGPGKCVVLTDPENRPEHIRFVSIGSSSSGLRFRDFMEHIRKTSGRLSEGLALGH
ncbi:MAG: LysR family transcriptional regulator [Nitrospirae bacterium]|nr:LysR family transcriptional regulator [Nitrospirota bacterium]